LSDVKFQPNAAANDRQVTHLSISVNQTSQSVAYEWKETRDWKTVFRFSHAQLWRAWTQPMFADVIVESSSQTIVVSREKFGNVIESLLR
jgi:hypothetical protein